MSNWVLSRTCLFFIFVLGLQPLTGFGQKSKTPKADKRYQNLSYFRAAKLYEKHLKSNQNDKITLEKAGDCYRLFRNSEKAELFYSKVATDFSKPIYFLHYGTSLMENGKYDDAIPQFQKYLESKPNDPLATNRLKSCQDYRQFYKTSGKYNVEATNINTKDADFGPMLLGDKLYFSSSRLGEDWIFGWNGHAFLDLFTAEYKGNSQLGKIVKLKGQVNSKFHEGGISFFPNGRTMYFTRNNFFKGKAIQDREGTILLKTYAARLDGDKWMQVESMNFNNDQYSTGHPALIRDGSKMIIVSDKPGGKGGTDLYLVERRGLDWSIPENLGPEINSAGNEMFPWISESGDLYYSSDGLPGMGGLDVIKATFNGTRWEKPENIGYPINSSQDDFSFVMDENTRVGFLSSNRLGGKGDDDIYSFVENQMYTVKVVDDKSGMPLKKSSVSFMDGETLISTFETNEDGKIGFFPSDKENFLVWAKRNEYDEEKQAMSILNFSPENEYTQEIRLHKKVPTFVPPAEDCDYPIVLDVKVQDYPNIRPDSGTFVKVYTKPKYFDVSKNPNFLDELAPGTDYVVVVEGEGTTPRTYEISTTGRKPHDTINYEIKLQPGTADVGKVFYIIYYNYDKSDIRIDASEELNRLERFMKRYPNVKVELASHTDSRGGDLYNDDLSRRRAREAFEYLASKGINKSRLNYKSYGENQLTNKCSNGIKCDESEHQMNRRTEFKITGI